MPLLRAPRDQSQRVSFRSQDFDSLANSTSTKPESFPKRNKRLGRQNEDKHCPEVRVFQGWCSPYPTLWGWWHRTGSPGQAKPCSGSLAPLFSSWLLGASSEPFPPLGGFWGWLLLRSSVTHGARTWRCCQSSAFRQLRSSAAPAPFQGLLQ